MIGNIVESPAYKHFGSISIASSELTTSGTEHYGVIYFSKFSEDIRNAIQGSNVILYKTFLELSSGKKEYLTDIILVKPFEEYAIRTCYIGTDLKVFRTTQATTSGGTHQPLNVYVQMDDVYYNRAVNIGIDAYRLA